MKHKKHFNLLMEMNELMIDERVLFTSSFPIENENKKREAAIVPEEFLVGLYPNRYHDWRSINASA
jgi:hypothetical protein